jgi:hypothetical protein
MLPSEKLELAIYRYINISGGRSVNLASLLTGANVPGTDTPAIQERLEDLEYHGRFALSKYVGTTRVPYAEYPHLFATWGLGPQWSAKSHFFGYDSFCVEVTPQGRKYFEQLEQRERSESQGQLVFISCGQFSEAERKLGRELSSAVDEFLPPFKGYFAQNQNSLDTLSRNIFGALNECAGFVAVLHRRGVVETPNGEHTRASVWIEQEIAIAAFLTQISRKQFPVAVYIQKGIKREGVRDLLTLNLAEFESESEVLVDFKERVSGGRFKPKVAS